MVGAVVPFTAACLSRPCGNHDDDDIFPLISEGFIGGPPIFELSRSATRLFLRSGVHFLAEK